MCLESGVSLQESSEPAARNRTVQILQSYGRRLHEEWIHRLYAYLSPIEIQMNKQFITPVELVHYNNYYVCMYCVCVYTYTWKSYTRYFCLKTYKFFIRSNTIDILLYLCINKLETKMMVLLLSGSNSGLKLCVCYSTWPRTPPVLPQWFAPWIEAPGTQYPKEGEFFQWQK